MTVISRRRLRLPSTLVEALCCAFTLALCGCGAPADGETDAAEQAADVATPDASTTDASTDDAPDADSATGGDSATGDAADPDAPADVASSSDTAIPDTAGSDSKSADTASPDATGPDTTSPDTTSPDTASPDTASDTATPDTGPAAGACKTSADCQQTLQGCVGNACIAGVCTPQTLADGTACSDGKPCTTVATCAAGICKAQKSVICDDTNPCTIGACDPQTGACGSTPAPKTTACDDGKPCTEGTACDGAGTCAGGGNSCGCASIKDCAAFDDGDPCNGTLYCNQNLEKPACELLPTSVVTCDTTADGPCQRTACAKDSGVCALHNKVDGLACEDGNPCTQGEACSAGSCSALVNSCQCQASADCLKYDDANPCNGTLYCDTSALPYACKVNPGSVVACPASTKPCQLAACDAKTGQCVNTAAPDGSSCSDGNDKTVGDICKAGTCSAGTNIAQCSKDAECANHEDGDFCNGVLFCNLATGKCQLNPATQVQCPTVDDTVCQKNTCSPASGLCKPLATADGTACTDDNACTVGEACEAGSCKPSADICQCSKDEDCATKDDGDVCNGTLYCDKSTGGCVLNKATIVACPTVDDGPCTKAVCAPKTGKCGQKAATDGSACEDDDPCTAGEACLSGACVGTKTCTCSQDSDCAGQDDGNLCNGTLFCTKKLGACVTNPATVKVCPTVDDTACAQTACEPKTGKCESKPVFTGAACDADGNPCTTNDYCDAGVCKPGKSTCGCYLDADCAGKSGDNKCVVSLFCDKTSFTCKPAKSVQCDTSTDTPCLTTRCDPTSGKCAVTGRPEGTICGESAICAGAQVCAAGKCVAGKSADCDDADACTADTCDAKAGCQYTALDTGDCDDGNVCTTADRCKKGQCTGTAKDCSDTTPCTDDACDPDKGCVNLPSKATVCDDGDLCSQGDFCLQGLCLSGSQKLVCDDGNPCTTDSCDAKQGCVTKTQNGGKCDDDDKCTTADTCKVGTCKGAQRSCDDGSLCSDDACLPDEGCVHLPRAGTPCDDGNACTVGDKCIASGLCASGQARVCDDANPCTVDLCDPLQQCVIKAVVGSKCDDGNACTVNDKCEKAQCSGSPRDCDDGLVCSKDTCDQDGGCEHSVTAGSKCDDGNACTGGDACSKSGACAAGIGLSCDDGNGCTTDQCEPLTGCSNKALDGIGCDDGNACTASDRCTKGQCAGLGKSCDDGQACTTDSCDQGGGCVHLAKTGTACTDDNACTLGDVCIATGYCKPGKPALCDDLNGCTIDACVPSTGCAHTIKTGAGCDDGNACTTGDTCNDKALCGGSPASCDDGRTCTKDSCDKTAGCVNAALTGASCSDGDACTVGDICLGSGACAPGSKQVCDDNKTCTTDRCDAQKGCEFKVRDKESCDDGSACTHGDTCKASACVGSPVSCDDENTCTKDSCDAAKGCVHAPTPNVSCSDGNACTQADTCSAAGTCKAGKGVQCDDGKPCTTDGCDAATGCTHTKLTGVGCTDANTCTGPDVCADGLCKGNTVDCDDGKGCTKDSCDITTGCKHTSLTGATCSDDNACTKADTCTDKGICKSGAALDCDDKNPCTSDVCDQASGCKNTALSGKECSDGDFCTRLDACQAGSCKGSAVDCDDSNTCTQNNCDKLKGCLNTPTGGATCNDGNACTDADKCDSNGACGGAKKDCDDSNVCTLDSCTPDTGCVNTKLEGAACNDNKVCTDSDKCSNGTCAGLTKSCDDGNECTADSCDTKNGCVNALQKAKACNDGDECTTGDACSDKAACVGITKNCSDANDCTIDKCNKYVGCSYSNAAADATCSDGDACTNDWCDGLGSCNTKSQLWGSSLNAGYTPYDVLVLADGSAVVVGDSGFKTTGGFFVKLVNKGKQPEVVPATVVYRWRRIVARTGGGYFVIGDTADVTSPELHSGNGQALFARLDDNGKIVKQHRYYGTQATPARWEALAANDSYAMVAAARQWQANPAHNWFAFGHYDATSGVPQYLQRWTPPGTDHYSDLKVQGITPLSGDRMYAMVSAVTRSGGRTWGVTVSKTGVMSQKTLWTIPYKSHWGTTLLAARMLPIPTGGFELLMGFNQSKRRIFDANAQLLSVHDAKAVSGLTFGTLIDAALRGDQLLALDHKGTLATYNRTQTAYHDFVTLAEKPSMLRVGPKRNVYLMFPPPAGSTGGQWRLERRDPWGNTVCTACLTTHGAAGCATSTAIRDACDIANGSCKNQKSATFCDDNNPCTNDAYDAKKGACAHTPKTGSSCSLADTVCKVSTNGQCNSAGRCIATLSDKLCLSFNPCKPLVCNDHIETPSAACASTDHKAGYICASGKSCSLLSCQTDSSVAQYASGTQSFLLFGDGATKTLLTFGLPNRKLKWLRVRVDVDSSAFPYDIELHTNNSVRKLLSSSTQCTGSNYSNCASRPKDLMPLVFPDPNEPAQWIDDKVNTYTFGFTSSPTPWKIVIKRTNACSTYCVGSMYASTRVYVDYY